MKFFGCLKSWHISCLEFEYLYPLICNKPHAASPQLDWEWLCILFTIILLADVGNCPSTTARVCSRMLSGCLGVKGHRQSEKQSAWRKSCRTIWRPAAIAPAWVTRTPAGGCRLHGRLGALRAYWGESHIYLRPSNWHIGIDGVKESLSTIPPSHPPQPPHARRLVVLSVTTVAVSWKMLVPPHASLTQTYRFCETDTRMTSTVADDRTRKNSLSIIIPSLFSGEGVRQGQIARTHLFQSDCYSWQKWSQQRIQKRTGNGKREVKGSV